MSSNNDEERNALIDEIDNSVFELYELTEKEVQYIKEANAKSHTYLQFWPATTKAKNYKRVCLAYANRQTIKSATAQQRIYQIKDLLPTFG